MRTGIKLLTIALALGAGFYANDIIRMFSGETTSIELTDYCMLSTHPCEEQNISMRLSTDTAHPLVASRLTVNWPETSAQKLELSLQGVEMEMGTVKYVLSKSPSGLFETDIILPVCTSNAMTWAGQLSDGEKTVHPAIRMER